MKSVGELMRHFPIQSERDSTPILRTTARKPAIRVSEPYPLLDPGEYVGMLHGEDSAATCTLWESLRK